MPEKIIKSEKFSPNSWRIFVWEAVLFFLTLILGIVAALKLQAILVIQKIELYPISIWQFLFYFLVITLFIFLISRFLKFEPGRKIVFKGIFILAIFWGGSLLLSLWLPDFLALILITSLIFWWLKWPSILNHDLVVILGLAGIGSVLGLRFSPWAIVLLLIILSGYDFIAVYKTKHMIKMAKEMIKTGTILALILPQRISDFRADIKEVRPGGKFLILGGGDVAFPLLLCASVVPQGIINALIVATFALFGLWFSFYFFISQKIRQPIPALPPIALFSILGFLITHYLI